MMYGMLLESVQHFVALTYGEAVWSQVLAAANSEDLVFSTHKKYQDSLMLDIARACSEVLGVGTQDDFLSYFGHCFVKYFSHYGYDKILRVSGRSYRDFLHGIDNLHETMRFSFPRMSNPSFYVEDEDTKGCLLHYRSKRVGFTYYVIGQLKQCGKYLYNQAVDVRVVEQQITDRGCHVVYRLNFDNSAFKSKDSIRTCQGLSHFPKMSSSMFFKVFSFSLVFTRDMKITQTGQSVSRLFKQSMVGQDITQLFMLRRPLVNFTWNNVICLQKVIFELEATCPPQHYQGKNDQKLLLKGQMRFLTDFEGIIFLCNPLINSLEELSQMGLYLNDLNMYDGSRDLVTAGWQHSSSLEYSIEQEVEKSIQISENLERSEEWRKKSESLLYSMIPKSIAVKLKQGQDPINTCEMFEEVTVMFSYLLGFTEMCSHIPAMDLVHCINSIFTTFDVIIDKHQVLKVETVGDAMYMVAGGLPQRTPHHAANVAAVALGLTEKVKHMFLPHTLSLRIGIHTGSVVAGVVGRKTPQYCLFGDTVNTASRMQSFGQSGQIHLSEPCNKCLEKTQYTTLFRGRLPIKGKGQMNTYWLVGRSDDPQIEAKCQYVRQESAHLLLLKPSESQVGDMLQQKEKKNHNVHLNTMPNHVDVESPSMPNLIIKEPKPAMTSAPDIRQTLYTRSLSNGSASSQDSDESGRSPHSKPIFYIDEDDRKEMYDRKGTLETIQQELQFELTRLKGKETKTYRVRTHSENNVNNKIDLDQVKIFGNVNSHYDLHNGVDGQSQHWSARKRRPTWPLVSELAHSVQPLRNRITQHFHGLKSSATSDDKTKSNYDDGDWSIKSRDSAGFNMCPFSVLANGTEDTNGQLAQNGRTSSD